ncbi:hypothetical protein ATCC90586_010232 [Pythium insidiosum]|nr:hypothetical protein ATCC90586_010232 [Pythium insidiosum]
MTPLAGSGRSNVRLAVNASKAQYGTKLTEAAAVNKLMQRKKQASETYQEYAMALRQAAEGPAPVAKPTVPKQQPAGVPAAGSKRKWQGQQGSGYSHYGPSPNKRRAEGPRRCYGCGATVHMIASCPELLAFRASQGKGGVKVDTCAAYSVAGVRMKTCGERLPQAPPMDYVQGLGGQQLRLEGLWYFKLRTVYNQIVELDALLVEGCDEEVLLGKDFLVDKKAKIDFETNEARYAEEEIEIIVPFNVSAAVGPAAVRALNQITVKDVYPLPRIDETLESLGGARRFTTLNLLAGYWQIAVAEQDRDKTAFVTRQVLARLEDHGLSIKAKKCTFAATRLEYLGHEITPEGVRPLTRLVDAVEAYPEPADTTSVKRFVHLAGYYRRNGLFQVLVRTDNR